MIDRIELTKAILEELGFEPQPYQTDEARVKEDPTCLFPENYVRLDYVSGYYWPYNYAVVAQVSDTMIVLISQPDLPETLEVHACDNSDWDSHPILIDLREDDPVEIVRKLVKGHTRPPPTNLGDEDLD